MFPAEKKGGIDAVTKKKTTCMITDRRFLCPFIGQAAFAAERSFMEFFNSAIDVLQTLVIALGAGLGIWGVINLLEGYGNDNPGAKSQGIKQFMAN